MSCKKSNWPWQRVPGPMVTNDPPEGRGEAGIDRGPENTSPTGQSVGCATPWKEQSVENCDRVNRALRGRDRSLGSQHTNPSARPCRVVERTNFSAECVDNPTDEQALQCSVMSTDAHPSSAGNGDQSQPRRTRAGAVTASAIRPAAMSGDDSRRSHAERHIPIRLRLHPYSGFRGMWPRATSDACWL
jgi:hypothetical protein